MRMHLQCSIIAIINFRSHAKRVKEEEGEEEGEGGEGRDEGGEEGGEEGGTLGNRVD